jgi:hypothetical protein
LAAVIRTTIGSEGSLLIGLEFKLSLAEFADGNLKVEL